MLELDSKLTLNAATIGSPNLCDKFSDEDLKKIGEECWAGYDLDEQSRRDWMRRNEAGMDLALQISEDKTFPWPNCANVAFPLVTIAAMQFHARAYPALIDGPDVVKCTIIGDDPDGALAGRAERIGAHMSWQRLYEDKAWEPQEDAGLLNLSIVGTNFKKSYKASDGVCVSELVLAKDLVLNYWSKSTEACPRKTHILPTFRNEVHENVLRGKWRDILEEPWYKALPTPQQTQQIRERDKRQGLTRPGQSDDTATLTFLEQHVNLDLDDDGYAEPYIVTFERESKCVVRIVTRFDSEQDIERVAAGPHKGAIIKINAREYFTKKEFIPSPDGGIYGIGFGVFLGPLNEAVNSLVNMLLDCGTMQTSKGGFLGRGAKIRGGLYTFAPFEWKRVDSTGDDLRKSLVPLEVGEPSAVLFQLLSLLINYTNRIAGTTDMMVGENPGQNTPAETARTMVEMGQKIYSAIFKRIWRATKEEFRKLYIMNSLYLDPMKTYPGGATREDYLGSPDEVQPVADPSVTSETTRVQLITAVKQAAMTTPGYNHDAVERRWLKAMHVENVDEIFPGTEGQPPQKGEKLQIAEMKEQGANQRLIAELQTRQQEFILTLMEQRRVNNAEILSKQAEAQARMADAASEQQYAEVAAINARISMLNTENDSINKQIDQMLKLADIRSRNAIEMKKLEQPKKEKAAA